MSDDLVALLRNPETPDYVIRDFILEMEGKTVANVYAVIGVTGEYSDKRTWTVAAFLDEGHANTVRDRLNKWCADNGYAGVWSNYRQELPKPPDDTSFKSDQYTGTEYVVAAIPLRAEG